LLVGWAATVLGGCDRSGGDTPTARASSSAPTVSAAKAASSAATATSPAAPAAPTRPAKPLNVLLITIDAMRADMPWSGYPRPIAPRLTQLAEKSVVYENVRSLASYTAQSVATWLSGQYTSTLYRAGWFFAGYAKSNVFFPEILQENGIRTIGVQSHMYFNRGKGIDQGFDVWEMVPGITFDPETDNHVTSHKTTALMQELLGNKENTGGQFFAWTHYTDPHDVYVRHEGCPEEWGKKNRDRYDCEIHYTDQWVGKLLDWAEKQPWWKDTALIVTSDHGEAFGEHGMYKHAFELWDVLVRVPLILHIPGAQPRRISEPRTLIDLAPTIMDLLGQKPLKQFVGKSWVPEAFGAPPEHRDVLVMELNEDSHNPPRRAIVKGDYKLIVYGKNAGWKDLLFNLADDPGEKTNLAKKQPEKLDEMKRVFADTFAKIPSVAPYGGMKLKGGGSARGPMRPPKTVDREAEPRG
jgi:choline-sulfatase